MQTKLAAAMNSVATAIADDFTATIKAAEPDTIEVDTLTPETVARQVSQCFGDDREVENLVVSFSGLAGLIPHNALSLNYAEPGTYGCGHICGMAGIQKAVASNDAMGVAIARDGVVMASAVPNFAELEELGAVAARPLGKVAGITMYAKSWVTPGSETIHVSVEAMANFAVSDKKLIRVIVPTAELEA